VNSSDEKQGVLGSDEADQISPTASKAPMKASCALIVQISWMLSLVEDPLAMRTGVQDEDEAFSWLGRDHGWWEGQRILRTSKPYIRIYLMRPVLRKYVCW
jgi:hypothetical protein